MFGTTLRSVPCSLTLFPLIGLLAAAGCGSESDPTDPLPAPNVVAVVVVDNPEVDLAINSSVTVTATARGFDGRILARSITWTSQDPGVAMVDAAGRITAAGNGTTRITASTDGKQAFVTVKVFTPPAETRSVAMAPSALTLEAGLDQRITATALAQDGSVVAGRAIIWESTNPAVASVDQTGRVTAHGPGTARIIARIDGYVGLTDVTVPAFAVWKLTSVNGQPLPAVLSIGTVIGEDGVARYARTVVLAGRLMLSVGNGRYQQEVTTETIVDGMVSVPTPHADLGNVTYLWPGDALRFESTVIAGHGFDAQRSGDLLRTRQRVSGGGEVGLFAWGR